MIATVRPVVAPFGSHDLNPSSLVAVWGSKMQKSKNAAFTDHLEVNHKNSIRAGFLLLNTCLRPLYANQEAVAALTYSSNPSKGSAFDGFFEKQVRSLFAEPKGELRCRDFITSGRRCYQVRMFFLKSRLANGLKPAIAVLLERHHKSTVDLPYVSEMFRLTKREAETLYHVAQDSNTNEIAEQMQISPCTVKVFLRSIMIKMRTNSRVGIMARILQNGHQRTAMEITT